VISTTAQQLQQATDEPNKTASHILLKSHFCCLWFCAFCVICATKSVCLLHGQFANKLTRRMENLPTGQIT